MSLEAFRARVRAALAAPADGPLAARFPAPLVTAIVAGAGPEDAGRLELALEELVAALERVGVPRGRQFVLLGALRPGPARETAARLRQRLGIPVLVHEPGDLHYNAGPLPPAAPAAAGPAPPMPTGTASPEGEQWRKPGGHLGIAVDDELREAEAVVVVGPAHAGDDGLEGGAGLLCPGVVSPRTRAAWEAARATGPGAARAFALQVERSVPADLALLWHADGSVTAGEGRARFTALAQAAGGA